MKRVTTAAALACALSLIAAGASVAHPVATGAGAAMPALGFGVADDASKYADDGGASFYGQLKGAGLTENRWTLAWDAENPTAINELSFLQRAAPAAQAAGVHVVLALYSKRAADHDPTAFCAWAGTVARTVAQWGINDLIVWNEPNTRLYWQPQKDAAGNDVAGPAYEALLAACYDSIKAANPNARVIGMGLSPRASTPESNEPLVFLHDVGKAYRASGRTKPLMDQLAIHPYPVTTTASPDTGYDNPNRFGIADLARVKQAIWDAFNGTAQPTTLNGLTFRVDEVGWQVDTTGLAGYFGDENVPTVTPQQQAQYLSRMISAYFACDPTVTDVLLFLLRDERYRDGRNESGVRVGGGWQSGLVLADGATHRPAYDVMAQLAAQGRAACTGNAVTWRPKTAATQPASKPKPHRRRKHSH
jgi:hypothetical protein